MLERIPVPRRLSSRVWLVTLPSALFSFERKQHVPRLPLGVARFGGIPLIIGGALLAVRSWRDPESGLNIPGPLNRLASKPATLGGLLVLAGVAVLLRSTVLSVYALGLAAAATSDTVSVEEPDPADFLPGAG